MADEVRRTAHAKVNPFLRVLGRRDDGFHDIETLIVPVSLADEVTVTAVPDDHLLWLVTTGESEGMPDHPANLAMQAAQALRAAWGRERGAILKIDKRIPVAAGLGGGSADAATVLSALAELWECDADLAAVAAEVGSDVPALLAGGPVIARGRGELVERVDLPPTIWWLAPADYGIAAADAYAWWDEDGGAPGPDPAPLMDALSNGDVVTAGRLLFNDLEAPILRRHPDLADTKKRLLQAGALGAIVCGSGPTVCALSEDGAEPPPGVVVAGAD